MNLERAVSALGQSALIAAKAELMTRAALCA
jgi:hypothetical protein